VRIDGKWYLGDAEVAGDELKRFDKMRLPPAWRQVTVAVDRTAKIQAVGLDKAGRWQYRYSEKHVEEAARKKFDRVKSFSKDMEGVRKGIDQGIKDNDPKAFLLELENKTAIRAGSATDFHAKTKAYGLTTLQAEHVQIEGNKIILDFIAKEGIPAHYELEDQVLAAWLRQRKEATAAGEMLFPEVSASKLNVYLKELARGKNYTIKDFRKYQGTRIALEELQQYAGKELTTKEKKAIIKGVCEKVSGFLKNTPGMAKQSYIDPMVWDFIGGL
jgi:DNA topoisomerase-1